MWVSTYGGGGEGGNASLFWGREAEKSGMSHYGKTERAVGEGEKDCRIVKPDFRREGNRGMNETTNCVLVVANWFAIWGACTLRLDGGLAV